MERRGQTDEWPQAPNGRADIPPMKPRLARLKAIFLGNTNDGHQRALTTYTFFALAIYIVFAFVQHLEVRLGLIDPSDSWKLTAWNLFGGIGFYALVRSGLNQRITRARNRSLSIEQSIWAMVGISWSYAITGPARGAVILIMLLVLIFGVFALNPARSRLLVIVGFAMLASVMVFKALTDPVGYDPRVEAMHLLLAGIVMTAVSALSVRIGKLQRKLEQQRNKLAEALEENQALAARDELTGLANRRTALERMHETMASQRDCGSTDPPAMGIALIDIDHFKRVNDQYGHAAGDEVLRRVASLGQAVIRKGDLLARWAGRNFCLPCLIAQAGRLSWHWPTGRTR